MLGHVHRVRFGRWQEVEHEARNTGTGTHVARCNSGSERRSSFVCDREWWCSLLGRPHKCGCQRLGRWESTPNLRLQHLRDESITDRCQRTGREYCVRQLELPSHLRNSSYHEHGLSLVLGGGPTVAAYLATGRGSIAMFPCEQMVSLLHLTSRLSRPVTTSHALSQAEVHGAGEQMGAVSWGWEPLLAHI